MVIVMGASRQFKISPAFGRDLSKKLSPDNFGIILLDFLSRLKSILDDFKYFRHLFYYLKRRKKKKFKIKIRFRHLVQKQNFFLANFQSFKHWISAGEVLFPGLDKFCPTELYEESKLQFLELNDVYSEVLTTALQRVKKSPSHEDLNLKTDPPFELNGMSSLLLQLCSNFSQAPILLLSSSCCTLNDIKQCFKCYSWPMESLPSVQLSLSLYPENCHWISTDDDLQPVSRRRERSPPSVQPPLALTAPIPNHLNHEAEQTMDEDHKSPGT